MRGAVRILLENVYGDDNRYFTARAPDGTLQTLRLDAECVTRGDVSNNYGGQTIVEPTGPGAPLARKGTTGVAAVAEAPPPTATLWVEKVEPRLFRPGDALTVTITGGGFDASTRFEFLRPGLVRTINDDFTIANPTLVDSGTFQLDVTVSESAALYPEGAPLAFDRR